MEFDLNLDHLIQTCATNVNAKTMAAIIKIESNNHPFTIYDNDTGKSYILKTKEDTIQRAHDLITKRHNIDIGLAQVNSANLKHLNLSIQQAIDPCSNITAGSNILNSFYLRAKYKFSNHEEALFRSLSAYNSGSFYKGIKYASKVFTHAGYDMQALQITGYISPYKAPVMVSWY